MRSSGPQEIQVIISRRDWCNLFDEISQEQEQIDQMQEKAMQSEQ
jgi:hypothetical protein